MLQSASDPVRTVIDGRPAWAFPNGRTIPVVSGGDGPVDPPAVPPPGPATPPADPATPPADPATPPVEPVTPPADPTAPSDDGDVPLRPEGQRALEAIKAENKKLKADAEAAKLAAMSDAERAIEEARSAGRAEATAESTGKVFAAELRAAVAGKIQPTAALDLTLDPEAAVRQLGLTEIPVTADGAIDSEALSQAVTQYVEARPYLAAGATPPPGSIDQGARSTPPVADLQTQIAAAEAAGEWSKATALKTQLMFAPKVA